MIGKTVLHAQRHADSAPKLVPNDSPGQKTHLRPMGEPATMFFKELSHAHEMLTAQVMKPIRIMNGFKNEILFFILKIKYQHKFISILNSTRRLGTLELI